MLGGPAVRVEGLGVVAGVAQVPILQRLQLCLSRGEGLLERRHLCDLDYTDGTTPARDVLFGLRFDGVVYLCVEDLGQW